MAACCLIVSQAAWADVADLEKELQDSLEQSGKQVSQAASKLGRGLDASPEIARLRSLAENIRITNLLLEERFRLREEKARSLGAEVLSRQQAMAEGYRKAIQEYLEIIQSLIPADGQKLAVSDQLSAISKFKVLLDKLIPKKKRPLIGSLPYKHLNYPSAEPKSTPIIAPAYHGGDKTVGLDDTKDTLEAPITKEIAALAQSLNWNPVSIYEYVKNNIETEWYWGCMKGAEETLHQKSGNDCDQATLLAALLRASGYPTRYVRGSVEFIAGGNDKPIDRIRNLFGIDDAANIARFLQKAGIPFKPIIAGGSIANFQIEHIWVESQIPYANYRGAIIDALGKTWLGLDTSIKVKGYQQNQPKDIYELSAVSGQLSQIRDQYLGIVSSGTGSTPFELNQTPLEYFKAELSAISAQQDPELTADSYKLIRTLIPEVMNILPAGLQFKEIAITNEYTSIPADLKHKVRFTAKTAQNLELMSIELDVFKLSNQQVTISYEPESVADQETINAWGGLDNTPAYLVRLRPMLKVNGQRLAVGKDGLAMGSDYQFTVELIGPVHGSQSINSEKTTNTLIVGNLTSIGIVAQKAVSTQQLADSSQLTAELLLHREAMNYIDRWNRSEEELASLLHLAIARPIPTVVTLGGVIDVTYLLDMPHGFTWKGVFLDADVRRVEIVRSAEFGVGSEGEREKLFMQLAGLQGSVLEHRLFEDDFQVESISTAKLIQLCTQNSALCAGMVTIDKNNIEAILPTLSLDDNIKEDMVNAVNQGYELRTVNSELVHHDWSGIGYITENLETGESGWMLSGMIAGSNTVDDVWLNQHYRDTLSEPYTGPFNPDALSATGIQKVTATEGQEDGIVGTELSEPIAVFVFDAKKQPVKEASVTFTMVAGGGSIRCLDSEGQAGPPSSTFCTTTTRGNTGIARARITLGTVTAANPDYKLYPGDANYTQVGLNIVTASARAYTAAIPLARPFSFHAKPGELAEIIKVYPTEPVMGLANNPAGTLYSRATDTFRNPISNMVLTFTVDKVESLDTRYMPLPPPTMYNKMGFYEQDACAKPYPLYGDCSLYTSLTVTTTADGAKVNTILGNTLGTLYTVKVSAPDSYSGVLPVYFDLLTAGRRDGPSKIVPSLLLVQALEIVTEKGDPINAAKAGSQLAAPLRTRMILIEDEIDTFEQSCTKNDQNGNPVSYTGYNLVSRGTVTVRPIDEGTVTFTSKSGVGQTGEVQNVHDGYYLASYTTITHPAVNTVEVDGSAAVIVRKITARDNIISYIPYDYCLESSEVGNIQITLKHGQHAVLDPFTHALLPEKTLISKPTYTIYGVGTTLTVEPPIVLVDEDGITRSDTLFHYTILPPEYKAIQADIDLFTRNGAGPEEWAGYLKGDSAQDQGDYWLIAGSKLENMLNYTAQVVLNRGTGAEIRGEKRELTVVQIETKTDESASIVPVEEIKFGDGSKPEKRYKIELTSAELTQTCGTSAFNGAIRTVLSSGETVSTPGTEYAPAELPLTSASVGNTCTIKVDGKDRFILSNRIVAELQQQNTMPSSTAILYGGIGNRIQVLVNNTVIQEHAIEPVGVIVLAIDGLRQDVLYAPIGSNDGTGIVSSFTDTTGCGGHSCYVQPQKLRGLCDVFGGKYEGTRITDPYDPDWTIPGPGNCITDGWENKHIKLPKVTTIFPSITFAAWASIYSGKQPSEPVYGDNNVIVGNKGTGIVGNEFFARDLYKPAAPNSNTDIIGLSTLPSGMVTLDPDGGALRASPAKGFFMTLIEKINASAPLALEHVMPAEFLGYDTLKKKLDKSAPGSTLQHSPQVTPLWKDINNMVAAKYQFNNTERCDKSKYECRTVSMFNQYVDDVDWWGTPSFKLKYLWEALIGGPLFDTASASETANFVKHYFDNPAPNGKRKRFPALFSVYLPGLDHDAHLTGMGNYTKFFQTVVDAKIGTIIQALKDKDEFDNKIFIIVSDHGETAMPTDLKYKAKVNNAGSIDFVPLEVEMSCSLKVDFTEPSPQDSEQAVMDAYNRKEAERYNNSLHIWELGMLFQQLDSAEGWRLLVPKEVEQAIIADLNSEEVSAVTSDIKQANVIAALNGPMAHIYVKGSGGWNNANNDVVNPGRFADKLSMYFAENGVGLRRSVKDLFPRLQASIDKILIRVNDKYKVFKGLTVDENGNITGLATPGPLDELESNANNVNALTRIESMNHDKRSGDIILLMKDDPSDAVVNRFSTAYACKAWHGSLSKSDSYVPLVISYPGGNNYAFISMLTSVCSGNACEGNWKMADLIKKIIETQYIGQ